MKNDSIINSFIYSSGLGLERQGWSVAAADRRVKLWTLVEA